MIRKETCAAVLLAAGASSRFGGDKLLAEINGEAVLEKSARALAAAGCAMPAAVISAKQSAHNAILEKLGFEIIANQHAAEGMSTSIQAGLDWAIGQGARSILVALADMPFLTAAHYDRLFEHAAAARCEAIFTTDHARRTPPALFAASQFEQLRQLSGDAGARQILQSLPDRCGVEAPETLLQDIDIPGDLVRD